MNDLADKKKLLIEDLYRKGITNKNVLKAISEVPREEFVIDEMKYRAYDDNALPITDNQTISQPYTVAYMTQLLDIEKGNKILEIGTGSGYQAAILYKCGASVYSVERIENLYLYSKNIFQKLNYQINQKLDDGNYGWQEFAPFDRIIITAALKEFPVKIMKQLKTDGKMVFPIGDKDTQTMNLIIKQDDKHYKQEQKDKFKFVPLIGSYGWKYK
jgi:protein-L-isoaspartate(D-aspartate) O-methyltransferase